MVSPEVLTAVRNGICAVGYITVSHEIFNQDLTKPYFKVMGTGFLVRPDLAMTNRHVIQAVLDEQAEIGFPDLQRAIMFVHPTATHKWQVTISSIPVMAYVTKEDVDVGFI